MHAVRQLDCNHIDRKIGMGVEQFVYHQIGIPKLTIVESVAGRVDINAECPHYISENTNEKTLQAETHKKACDDGKIKFYRRRTVLICLRVC